MEQTPIPIEVLHRILGSLPASSVAAVAVAHPALAAAARTLPELSHVRLRLALQPSGSPQPRSQGAVLRCEPSQACALAGCRNGMRLARMSVALSR